jgi:hypothetical protein
VVGGPYRIDAARYKWLHAQMARLHGRAAEYVCSRCYHRHATQWACVADYENFDDYWPLCGRCHRAFDDPMTFCRAGVHPWTPEHYKVKANGRRFCNSCRNDRRREFPPGTIFARSDKGQFTRTPSGRPLPY